jgi:hypothetical protein
LRFFVVEEYSVPTVLAILFCEEDSLQACLKSLGTVLAIRVCFLFGLCLSHLVHFLHISFTSLILGISFLRACFLKFGF